MDTEIQVVSFRIGPETFGIKIGFVREIVRVPEITSVPSAPVTVEGVINLRGKIIPVMDLRKRFLVDASPKPDGKNRIVVVELEKKLVGLIVSAASGVIRIPSSEIAPPSSLFAEGESGYITGVARQKNRLLILLDVDRLLQQKEFTPLQEVAEAFGALR